MVIDKIYTARGDDKQHIALGTDDGMVLGLTDEIAKDLKRALNAGSSVSMTYDPISNITVIVPGGEVIEGYGEITMEYNSDDSRVNVTAHLDHISYQY